MIDFFGIIHLIGQAFSIVNNVTSGDNKQKLFRAAMARNARKALNVAEDIFDLMDEYINGNIESKHFKKKYKVLKKKFNDLD